MKHHIVYSLSLLLYFTSCIYADSYFYKSTPVSETTRQFILKEFAKRNITFPYKLKHHHSDSHYHADHDTIFVPNFLCRIIALANVLNAHKTSLEYKMNQCSDELYSDLQDDYNFIMWLLDVIKSGSIDELLSAQQRLHDAINFYDKHNNEHYKQVCINYLTFTQQCLNTHAAILFHEYTHIQESHVLKSFGILIGSAICAQYVHDTCKYYQNHLQSSSHFVNVLYSTGSILLSCLVCTAPLWLSKYHFEQTADDNIPDEEELLENIIKELDVIEQSINQSYIAQFLYIIDPHPSTEKRIARFRERIEKIQSSGYSRALINHY